MNIFLGAALFVDCGIYDGDEEASAHRDELSFANRAFLAVGNASRDSVDLLRHTCRSGVHSPLKKMFLYYGESVQTFVEN